MRLTVAHKEGPSRGRVTKMPRELSKREVNREEYHRLHDLLLTLCARLSTNYEPFGRQSRETEWGRPAPAP